MEHDELKHWIAFTKVPYIGTVRIRLLEKRFGKLSSAWSASEGDLREAGLDERATRSVLRHRNKIDPDAELALLDRHSCSAITWNDSEYPARLKEIDDAAAGALHQGRAAAEGREIGRRGRHEAGHCVWPRGHASALV